MSDTGETQAISQGVRLALGAVAAVLIAAAGYFFFPVETPAPSAPMTVAAPAAVDPPATPPAPVAIAEAPDAEAEKPAPPVFDTFRVEPDGSMVVAGRAEPSQIVDIMLADSAIDRVTSDMSGSFVSFPVASPSEAPRTLSLIADPDGAAIRSEVSYIVSPIAPPRSVLADAPGATVAPSAAPAPAMPGNDDTADVPVAIVEAAQAPVTNSAPTLPTVLQADGAGIRVVQSAPKAPATADDPDVALDAITYDPNGAVQISGRASGDGAVQIYLDNAPVSASAVTEGGDWKIELPDIKTGVYTLRIDEVDETGDVVSRLETPFKREVAQDVADALAAELAQEGSDVAVRTVQPGSTLWAIAEENLGHGLFFVEVYAANSDLIKDPDLIYPGQILSIPQRNE
ncbi:LysM peptidoglycan-binding domain-containing protein [Yoonia sediminilitoris]|uniref:LysM peptidoglycan-binding domain-containing protein n=1 Tax=Yoonia sediminilitoris TaxID=1286148 RepID=UPI001FE824B2|nr:LysM peptidoglycan-binding domain-containing protein [Yoonia sediminilitoris]